MANYLYKDFLQDREQYFAAERYWQTLVEAIAEAKGQKGQWPRWLARTYADGETPLPLDGNPIWDARSLNINRAFRIIQRDPDDLDIQIGAWLNVEKEEFAKEIPSEELVIHLKLTEDTAELTRMLLEKWMDSKTTPTTMRQFIDQVIPR